MTVTNVPMILAVKKLANVNTMQSSVMTVTNVLKITATQPADVPLLKYIVIKRIVLMQIVINMTDVFIPQ
jgi:hypothetical protein